MQVLVRNFTRKPLERKFISGYQVVRVLSDNAYELRKLNGKTFKVNTNHIRPYGNVKLKWNEVRTKFKILLEYCYHNWERFKCNGVLIISKA